MVLGEYPKAKLLILGKDEEQKSIVEAASRLRIKDEVIYKFEFIQKTKGYYIMPLQTYAFSHRFTNLSA